MQPRLNCAKTRSLLPSGGLADARQGRAGVSWAARPGTVRLAGSR
jgi:hypothetical protein